MNDILGEEFGEAEKRILDELPFTEKELESDFDETGFMDKLSTYLEKKYEDDEDLENKDDIEFQDNQLSMLDILTMKEEELDKIMPVDDRNVNQIFDVQETKGMSKRKSKKRKTKQYHKPPQRSKKKKKVKKNS